MLRSKKNDDDEQDSIPLQTDSQRQHKIRNEQTLEAEVLSDDTLVSIALRFNCSVADIKRLNKIHQENEIFAFKVLKVPLTIHNILIDTIPKVHKSGSNSPNNPSSSNHIQNSPTNNKNEKLAEKLIVASVNSAVISKSGDTNSHDDEEINESERATSLSEPLLHKPQFRALRPPRNDLLTFSGSDCELNWVFLLVAILLLCFFIPLIYVWLVYEHPEKFNHTHSRYDDVDLHYRAHFNDGINTSTQKLH